MKFRILTYYYYVLPRLQLLTKSHHFFYHMKFLMSPQARDGNSVCVALSGQDGKYVIINIHEGNVWT